MSLPQTNAKLCPPVKLDGTMFLSVITKSTCPSTEKQINKQTMICSHHTFSHNNGHQGMNTQLGQGHLERISGIFPEGQRFSTISGSWECLQRLCSHRSDIIVRQIEEGTAKPRHRPAPHLGYCVTLLGIWCPAAGAASPSTARLTHPLLSLWAVGHG